MLVQIQDCSLHLHRLRRYENENGLLPDWQIEETEDMLLYGWANCLKLLNKAMR